MISQLHLVRQADKCKATEEKRAPDCTTNYDCENDYGKNMFGKEDFQTLADQLATIKGKFLLSLNDRSEVREIFKAFDISNADTTYSTGSRGPKKVSELIIKNY